MTDKKLLAFLIVCAAIMAGTVIQVTQHVSDGNGNSIDNSNSNSYSIGNSDGDTVGMQIRTGDAVVNETYTWTFQSANTSMGTVSTSSAQVPSSYRMQYLESGNISSIPPQATYCTVTPATGFVFDYWEGGIPKQPEYIYPSSDLTLTAHFKQTWTSGDCTCTLTDDGVFTVSGNGAMQDYSASSRQPWTSVSASITSLVVQSGVTSIGDYAFYNCTSLASVDLGSVTSIGDVAFGYCTSLASMTIPNSVTSIGGGAFMGCRALTSVTIPNSVTYIWDGMFDMCTSLASVTIPNSVTYIGVEAFSDCTSLVDIFFLTTTWNITSIGSHAFSLGTETVSVSATVHSPNNVANGQLDAYKGDYTTLTYVSSVPHTYTINVNDATYGSVSPTSVQIYDGTSVDTDGNRLVFSDGQTVTATPAQATAQYAYTFGNWTFGNLTQTANFTRTINSYTVTFQSSDTSAGAVSPNTVTVPYGITYSVNGNVMTFSDGQTVIATPTTSTEQYTYAFDSWSSASGTVEQNMTITANFTRTLNSYTVTFAVNNPDYGSVQPGSATLPYGTTIEMLWSDLIQHPPGGGQPSNLAQATPATATAQYTYAFDSWSGIPEFVNEDVTITANFTRTLNSYTVTFAVNNPDYGSVQPGSATLPYGTTIEIVSSEPTRLIQHPPGGGQPSNLAQATPATSTEQYSYVFDSWSGIPEFVNEDVTITANFARYVSYKVTFAVNNAEFGSVQYDSLWIQEGSVPTVDGNVISFVSNAKQNTATAAQATDAYFYLFESWTGVPQQITGDVTITAQFVRADKMNVDVLAKEVIDIDVSQQYSGATEHHQTDYGDWISLANGHLKGTVPADLADGHYYLVWWAKESLPRADWTAYYVLLHPTDSKTIQLSQDAEQTIHSDGKVQILGRGVMSNQMARLLDPYKDIVNVVDIRGITTVQYMPAISNNYILVLGDSVTGFKDESTNHFDAIVIGGGINSFTVTGFHAYDKDGKEITGSALRGRVLIEQRTMQYEEIGITEVDNHYHNATCYAVQGSTLDNSENDRIKFSVTGAGSIPQYILDLLAHSGQSWNVEMQSGSSFKNVTIDTEGVLQGVQSNSVGTYTGTQSALFTNTDYGAMYSCTMSQAIAFQVFVQYKLVIN